MANSMEMTTDVGRWPPASPHMSRQPSRVAPSLAPSRKKSWFQRCCGCCSSAHSEEDVEEWRSTAPGVRDRVTDRDPDRSDTEPTVNINDRMLVVTCVDLLKDRRGQNRRAHHTHEYEYDDLIVRRGKPFEICLTFSRPFKVRDDKVILQLHIGNAPQVSKDTLVIVPTVNEFDEGRWGAQVKEVNGKTMTMWVNTSAKAIIGKYQLTVKTESPGGTFVMQRDPKNDIYILFNPWCRLDDVFMDNEAWKYEYIMNETGRLYYGTEQQIGERSWNYGQFDRGVLDACLYILDRGGMPYTGRCDPIAVCRVVSAMVNSLDDNGVVAGNWSGDYNDGVSPTAWVGSVDILLRYHHTGNPVSYGQCWVFSGVTTTVLRCLGIPSRSITNFASAHDTDASLTLDVYFDENMNLLEDMNTDSVWNYHVWNDCWMTRPDLPTGFDGWQAVDSTPQETSSGLFRCGPSPLPAIKNGLVYLKYDTPFCFAEVNSDKVYWQRQAGGNFKKVCVEEKAVGHRISTKAVGSNAREDITHLYKHPEGSEAERQAVRTAAQYGSKPSKHGPNDDDSQDVQVTIEAQDGCMMGSDISMQVTVRNSSGSQCSISLVLRFSVMYYTGVCRDAFKEDVKELVLAAGEAKSVVTHLKYSEYRNQLVDQGAMMLTVSGQVKETGQTLAKQHSFRLRTPDLTIRVLGEPVVGNQITAEITFTNPLQVTLCNTAIHVEGPGLQRPKVVRVGDIGPQKSITILEHFTPRRPGPRQFIASLESDKLNQVHGVTEVIVRDA
ncbi:protein-glutamine gamma-glutamyltransferase K [Microcaecilia unicolor]|uniref:Protein-glutamine gamma-glutamyltransferase K n=1 Tax=Microcaecilia unicolor TaxID=1415580 RepID=A0A6P7WHN1_9AMPH|nr:protein-glutamine gamma-glutamyltransferase K [Microcaecilia unicolor]